MCREPPLPEAQFHATLPLQNLPCRLKWGLKSDKAHTCGFQKKSFHEELPFLAENNWKVPQISQ